MADSIYTDNGVQVIQRFTDGTNIWENVYNVDNLAPASLGDLADIEAVFHDWEASTASIPRSHQVKTYEFECTALDSADAPRQTFTLTSPILGQDAEDMMPGNVTFSTRLEGPGHRRFETGRSYWVGIPLDQTAKNTVVAGYRDTVLDAMEALGAALIAIGKFLVVLSKVFRKAPRAHGIMTPITSYSADLFLDSQRRRLDTRGS